MSDQPKIILTDTLRAIPVLPARELCLCHIRKDDGEALRVLAHGGIYPLPDGRLLYFTVDEYDAGYYLPLSLPTGDAGARQLEDMADILSAEFCIIYEHLVAAGVRLLVLDRDAPEVDGLPVFFEEWGGR